MDGCYGDGDGVLENEWDMRSCSPSTRKRVIGCKWVYMKKPTVREKEREKFKAHLIAKVYS